MVGEACSDVVHASTWDKGRSGSGEDCGRGVCSLEASLGEGEGGGGCKRPNIHVIGR